MTGDVKVLNQNSVSAPVSGSPVVPQGSLNKEQSPIRADLSEFVKPAGPETSPSPSAEEKEAGVEVKSDRPDLTFKHKDLGVEHAGASVPVSTAPIKVIQYPMSEEEVGSKLKTGQNDDSGKGLAKLIQKVIKAMGF